VEHYFLPFCIFHVRQLHLSSKKLTQVFRFRQRLKPNKALGDVRRKTIETIRKELLLAGRRIKGQREVDRAPFALSARLQQHNLVLAFSLFKGDCCQFSEKCTRHVEPLTDDVHGAADQSSMRTRQKELI